MKLARKLTLAILSVMVAVFAIHALERINRDGRVLRDDIRRDHRTLGRALRAVVPDVWRDDGPERALALIEANNKQSSVIFLRWVWPYGSGDEAPLLSPQKAYILAKAKAVEEITERDGQDWLFSYVPVRLHDGRVGSVEISESLAFESEQMRATILRTVLSTLLIASLAAILTSWLGVTFVGKPIALIMEKARRVGAGDLSGPLSFKQKDELGDLAEEMNAMCERLDAAQTARNLALEQLRHAERLTTVGRLAAGVAHELGTPLNVVTLEAKRIALGKAQGPEAEETARGIEVQARRMTEIISQLLEFARRKSPRPIELDLGDVAESSVALLASLAQRHHMSLKHTAIEPARVSADLGQLQQVLANLVVNAIQASPRGSSILIETGVSVGRSERPCAFMRVTDHGSGMEPEVQARIFEPFFTTKDVGHGTGLGLSVAHGIMEEHAGSIEVESTPGQGAVFTVRLPVSEPGARLDPPAALETRPASQERGEAT